MLYKKQRHRKIYLLCCPSFPASHSSFGEDKKLSEPEPPPEFSSGAEISLASLFIAECLRLQNRPTDRTRGKRRLEKIGEVQNKRILFTMISVSEMMAFSKSEKNFLEDNLLDANDWGILNVSPLDLDSYTCLSCLV